MCSIATRKLYKEYINRYPPGTSKLLNLGWKLYYSLEEGFKRTIESFYIKHGNRFVE